MAVPKYDEMYKPILYALKDKKVHSLKELKLAVKTYFSLTDKDMEELVPSQKQTYFDNRVGWSRTFLKKAGLIESPARAFFKITERGIKVIEEKPKIIDNDYLLQFEDFKPFYYSETNYIKNYTENNSSKLKDENIKTQDDTPDDMLSEAYCQIYKKLSDELLEEILKLKPIAFERFVLDLLYKMGYGAFRDSSIVTNPTRDNGIDGIIMEDKLGFNLIYTQVKRYDIGNNVGRPDIQKFVGAISGEGGKGLFVTTSKFTYEAIEYAKKHHIILIDGEKLVDYMIEYNFGVSTKQVYEIKSMDTDLFNEYDYE